MSDEGTVVGFDGVDGQSDGCVHCGLPRSEHKKERVYGGRGPTGSYHYKYHCP